MFSVRIAEKNVGKRTDKLLAERLPQFPRAALQKLFNQQLVWLNDKIVKPGIKVKVGDKLSADLSLLDIKIAEIDLPVLYEDKDVLVINKPSGVISHARGRFFDEPSVASFVRQVTHQQGERAGIVHRLDRATSGVMICAKNQTALSWLQKQFSQRKVTKTYLAVISGKMPSNEGVIDMPIARNPKSPQTFHVSSDGKPAVTRYHVAEEGTNHQLIVLEPATGRTHQLRVHLKALHHPIVGDTLFGGAKATRLMLHAEKLRIILPSGQAKEFVAPRPMELMEALNA